MSYLGMFKTVARTELKELVPDVSNDTLTYLNRVITAAYDLRNKEVSELKAQVEQLRIALQATRQPHMDYIPELDKTALQVLDETTPTG